MRKVFDDYEIVTELDRRNNNRYYRVRCKVCGHVKEVGINNLKKQNNHHSAKNCKYDFYKSYIGKQAGDYICIGVEYDTQRRGYVFLLRCTVCGFIFRNPIWKERKHNAYTCKSQITDKRDNHYHNSLIGKVFGDMQIIDVENGYYFSAKKYKAKCIKCGTECIMTMAALKRNITHGSHCMKQIPDSIYKTVIMNRYHNMYQRCNNPNNTNYSHYGARGIKLMYKSPVDLYYDFIDELKEYSKTYSLRNSTFDRIDVNGNYEKSNLRITNQNIQTVNTTKRRIFIIYKDNDKVISDNAMYCGKVLGINGRSLGGMLRGASESCHGWKLLKIVNEPFVLDEVMHIEGVTTNLITSL